jgi:hypothetical protein
MTAENNNTFNHSRFVILLRRKFSKSKTSPISPTPIENAASCNEGGPDGTGPRAIVTYCFVPCFGRLLFVGDFSLRPALRSVTRYGVKFLRGVIFRFPVLRQNRGHYTQCLDFVFQPRLFKLFLSQNFVNVLHVQTPRKKSGVLQNNRVRQGQASESKRWYWCSFNFHRIEAE